MKAWILGLSLVLVAAGSAVVYHARQRSGFLWISGPLLVEIFTRKTMPEVLDRFYRDMGRYPTSMEGLTVLFVAPEGKDRVRWKGRYVEADRVPRDPWGREYQYRYPGLKNPRSYDLWSLGRDGVVSQDDVGNWGE